MSTPWIPLSDFEKPVANVLIVSPVKPPIFINWDFIYEGHYYLFRHKITETDATHFWNNGFTHYQPAPTPPEYS